MTAARMVPYEMFSVSVTDADGEATVVCRGELDMASREVLEARIRELEQRGHDRIVIDLSNLAFMDSSGLRVLLSIRNTAVRQGRSLELVAGPRPVDRIFDLTCTRGLFDWRAR